MPNFRPILSAINTPGHNLAKFLIPILEPLTHNEFTIKESFRFAKDITNYDSSFCMVSLDVESIFLNIPLNEAINNCVSDLYNKNLYNGKLSKRDLFKLPEAATSESVLVLITCFTNKLTFLDIKITRHNQQFKTSIYRKLTFNGVFLHYESYVDQAYKK